MSGTTTESGAYRVTPELFVELFNIIKTENDCFSHFMRDYNVTYFEVFSLLHFLYERHLEENNGAWDYADAIDQKNGEVVASTFRKEANRLQKQ